MKVKQMADDSLVEKVIVVEEPQTMTEVPSASEKPATVHSALGSGYLKDLQEDNQVEVHTPDNYPDNW